MQLTCSASSITQEIAALSLGMVTAMTALQIIGVPVNGGTLVVALDEVSSEPLPCQSLRLHPSQVHILTLDDLTFPLPSVSGGGEGWGDCT